MVQMPVHPSRNRKGVIGPTGSIGTIGWPSIWSPELDEDLILFCLYLAIIEGVVLKMSVIWVGAHVSAIDGYIDKQRLEYHPQIEKILYSIRTPLVSAIIREFPENQSTRVQVVIKIRIFVENGTIMYHTRAKGKDVGTTYIRRGVLTKLSLYEH